MAECEGNCPYNEFQKYSNYYDVSDYGDRLISAAFSGESTLMLNGNMDFALFGDAARADYIKRSLVTMNLWMWVVRQMNFAIDICEEKTDCPATDEFCKYNLVQVLVANVCDSSLSHVAVDGFGLQAMRALDCMHGTELSLITLDRYTRQQARMVEIFFSIWQTKNARSSKLVLVVERLLMATQMLTLRFLKTSEVVKQGSGKEIAMRQQN